MPNEQEQVVSRVSEDENALKDAASDQERQSSVHTALWYSWKEAGTQSF